MKFTISFKPRLKDQVVAEPLELTDVREIHVDFERNVIRVRYGVELAAARTSQWGEWPLDEVENYDWDEGPKLVNEHAVAMFQARKRTEKASEERQKLTDEVTLEPAQT